MTEKIKDLEKVLNASGINGTVIGQDVSFLIGPGENFGSLILKLDIKLKTGDEEETLHAVAKCVPKNAKIQKFFQTQVSFRNELTWYAEIIPAFKEFQKKCGIKEISNIFTNFYGGRISLDPNSNTVDENAVILMENLVTAGYKIVDRQIGFDYDTTLIVLKSLAEFHVGFLGIKQKNPDFFIKKIDSLLKEIKEDDADDYSVIVNYEFLKNINLSEYEERIAKNLKEYDPFGVSPQSMDNAWLTVCHTDFWINNIMVENNSRSPKHAKILDLQFATHKSLVSDLVFLLLTSVELKTIKKHFEDFLKYYYECFLNNLSQYKLDDRAYSYTKFLQEVDYNGKRGQFGHALHHIFYVHADKDKDQKYAYEEEFDIEATFYKINRNLNQRHLDRFKWLITKAVERNWI